jgi:hypothetical protein
LSIIPNFIRAGVTVYRHQTWINEARLAIALERFRMRNDRLPDALSALVPDYLDALPPDIVTGEPLRYRRLTEDHFLIWSVGWNEVDEDGAVGDGQDVGDWVWFGF